MTNPLLNMPKAAAMLIVAAAFFFMPATAYSQTPGRGHEVRFGVGGVPSVLIVRGLSCGCGIVYYPGTDNRDRFVDYSRNVISPGTFSFEYSYTTGGGRSSFGAVFAVNPTVGMQYDGLTGEQKGRRIRFGASVYPSYRLTYNPRNLVKAYSGISMGFGIGYIGKDFSDDVRRYDSVTGKYTESRTGGVFPVFQIVPVGLSFGRKVFGFAEIQAGTLTFGGRVGVGYKFGGRRI